jgi:hypothetical protein
MKKFRFRRISVRAATLIISSIATASAYASFSDDAPVVRGVSPEHSRRADIPVTDATPEFWRFWDATSGKPDGERVQAFFDTVVAARPDLFSGAVLGGGSLTNRSDDPAVRERVATYLRDVSPYIPRMRALSNRIRHFPSYAQEFGATFSNYAPTTPVYFTVSLFAFDAGVRIASGQTALFFSIDGIARFDGADANFKIIIDHELFHQYHHQITPELSESRALWAYLWEEGLATFVSQQLNPRSSEAAVLMVPANLPELAGPLLPAIARELLANLDSTRQDEITDFFALNHHRPGLPVRSGYYAGYRIAKKLASTRSLRDLAALQGSELKAAIQKTLDEFARER